MAPLSFRVNVPANTPALAPVEIILRPAARFLTHMIGPFSLTANLDLSRCGWRLFDRGHSLFFMPEVGSNDNTIQTNPGESGWAPILPSAQKIPMDDTEIQGPPYEVTLSLYNSSSGAIVVAGFLFATEQFIVMDRSMIYEFAEQGNPPREFVVPQERPVLPMEGFPGMKKEETAQPRIVAPGRNPAKEARNG